MFLTADTGRLTPVPFPGSPVQQLYVSCKIWKWDLSTVHGPRSTRMSTVAENREVPALLLGREHDNSEGDFLYWRLQVFTKKWVVFFGGGGGGGGFFICITKD